MQFIQQAFNEFQEYTTKCLKEEKKKKTFLLAFWD